MWLYIVTFTSVSLLGLVRFVYMLLSVDLITIHYKLQ